jgi:uncharacterized membrane protein YkoI
MKTFILGAALLSAGVPRMVLGQSSPLERCASASLAKHPGQLVKLEIETATTSVEPNAQPAGTGLWELESRAADGAEWEMTCTTSNGRIVEIEREVRSADDSVFKAKTKVSEADARKTALAAHGGQVGEVEYEIESTGAATYEIDITPATGSDQWKVEVDATTGKIVESRHELYQIGIEESAVAH